MAAQTIDVTTSAGDVTTIVNHTAVSIFERYSWVGLLAVHGQTALQVDRIVTPVWYVIGVTGNILSVIVWLQRRMLANNSSAVYLVALSVSDLLFLLLHFVQELQYAWSVPTLHYPVICESYFLFYLMTQYLSPMLVLGFTAERYIAVCHPFHKERLCRSGRARRVVAAVTVSCTLLAAIQAYFWTYDTASGQCTQRVETTLAGDEGGSLLWSVWSWVSELTVFLVIPLVILTFNVLVIRELRALDRHPPSSGPSSDHIVASALNSSNGKNQVSNAAAATTAMLLTVSFYVIATTLPATVVYVVEESFPQGSVYLTDDEIAVDDLWQRFFRYLTVRKIVEEICLSHYACNVFLYMATGTQFRRTLLQLFYTRCGRRLTDGSSAFSVDGLRPHARYQSPPA